MDISEFPTMEEAIDWLGSEGIPRRQVSPHQLKVDGDINWYPAKGTIVLDTKQRRHKAIGLSALVKLLTARGYRLAAADPGSGFILPPWRTA